MARIIIDESKCIGCGSCLSACPFGAINMDGGCAACDETSCVLCQSCLSACPVGAITLEDDSVSPSEAHTGPENTQDDKDTASAEKYDKNAYKGVWVIAETWKGKIHTSAAELLSEGRKLADALGEELAVVVPGGKSAEEASFLDNILALKDYGADRAILGVNPELDNLEECRYSAAVTELIRRERPAVVLYAATTFGRGMAPMVAAALNTGLTADCTGLGIREGERLLEQTRPAFGGNIMATIICRDRRPQMATVRPGVFKAVKTTDRVANDADFIRRIPLDDSLFAGAPKILSVTERTDNTVRLEEAKIIFAGGAGLADEEGFRVLKEAAAACGAVVGASRGAVDLGLADHAMQIGQTGTVVAPRVYVAAGISGAIQHVIGMQNADCIVAINQDPEAPIFHAADIGIVGDAREALEMIKNHLSKA